MRQCLFLVLLFISPLTLQARTYVTQRTIDNVGSKYGKAAKTRVVAWQKLIKDNKKQDTNKKLQVVNNFFNRLQFRSDAGQIGRTDYWMTPIEFLGRGGGDCEDFAIGKYFTLEALGVAERKLRITYVKALSYGQAHMVLTYFATPDAIPLVLDNLVRVIKPATERKDLLPVYSFNGGGLWLAKQRGQGRRVSGASRLSLWKDLNKRMAREMR